MLVVPSLPCFDDGLGCGFPLDLTLPVSWRAAMDVGGKSAGTVSGSMNMAGQIGGVVGPVVVGYILHCMNHDWMLAFWISAAIYALGGICWLLIDPVTPIDADDAHQGPNGIPVATLEGATPSQ